MPGPEQVIRAAITLPWAIARRVVGTALDLLPISDEPRPDADFRSPEPEPSPASRPEPEPEPREAAVEAITRERDPAEELPEIEDDLSGHVEAEVELVAEVADAEAPDPPGPQIHVDEPWEGYRRMRVDEIVSRLEGQSPEVLAAVELYESTHRSRGGVLNAVRDLTRG